MGTPTAELGIAWLLEHPEVSTVVVGARRREQLVEYVKSTEWRLAPKDASEARRIVAAPVVA